MGESFRFLGIYRVKTVANKTYQAILGMFQRPWKHRVLKRKFRTKTAAEEYAPKVIKRFERRYKVEQPRAKKVARFS